MCMVTYLISSDNKYDKLFNLEELYSDIFFPRHHRSRQDLFQIYKNILWPVSLNKMSDKTPSRSEIEHRLKSFKKYSGEPSENTKNGDSIQKKSTQNVSNTRIKKSTSSTVAIPKPLPSYSNQSLRPPHSSPNSSGGVRRMQIVDRATANGGVHRKPSRSPKRYMHPDILSKRNAYEIPNSFEDIKLMESERRRPVQQKKSKSFPSLGSAEMQRGKKVTANSGQKSDLPNVNVSKSPPAEKVYYRIINSQDEADSWQADYFSPSSYDTENILNFPRRRWLPRLKVLYTFDPK